MYLQIDTTQNQDVLQIKVVFVSNLPSRVFAGDANRLLNYEVRRVFMYFKSPVRDSSTPLLLSEDPVQIKYSTIQFAFWSMSNIRPKEVYALSAYETSP